MLTKIALVLMISHFWLVMNIRRLFREFDGNVERHRLELGPLCCWWQQLFRSDSSRIALSLSV